MNAETAVVGLGYWNHESGETTSTLEWAPWVNRKTWAMAAGDWKARIEAINRHLGYADLDVIAEQTGGEIKLSADAAGRGGHLTLAGVLAAVELAAARGAAPARAAVGAMAELAAACEAEGTPLAPVAALVRASRRCVECGSLVHGEYCTHCTEG